MTVSFSVTAQAVTSMLLLMMIGLYSAKTGIIDEPMSKKLSKLTVNVAQPFMLVNALVNVEYSRDNLKAGLGILGIGLLSHAILALFSFLCAHYVRRDRVERILTEYSMTFVNAGFMGFPILSTLFGDMGLFWGAFYVVAFNLSVWSYGMIVLSRAKGKAETADGEKIKINPLKMVWNHGTTPCILGFLLFVFQIHLPAPVSATIGYMNNICTPIVLLVIGANLARLPLKEIFLDVQMYIFAILRLLAAPTLIALLYHICGMSDDRVVFFTIMASLPTAAVTAMFAEIYDLRPDYASKTVGMSTLLSMFTIPVAVAICNVIIKL
ncbi:MAG: AEC family transporter [Clostridia bacterium]|nr:AEC family transporter [Clostridia bacterium]